MLEKNQEVEVYVNRTDVECSYGYGWWPAVSIIKMFCFMLQSKLNLIPFIAMFSRL